MIRDKEIVNSEKLIRNNNFELDKLQAKLDDLQESGNVQRLQDQLADAKDQKKQLQVNIRELEIENKELGKKLQKMTYGHDYQRKIKQLMEDLRMWKDKNTKM